MIPSHRRVNANPRDPGFYQDPYRLYRELSEHRLYFWEAYQMWCLNSFELVDAVLRDRRFARNPDGPRPAPPAHLRHFEQVEKYSLLNLEGRPHRRIRSLVNHAFAARQVQALAPMIEQQATALLNSLYPCSRADLLPGYASPLPAGVIADMLGVPGERIPDLLRWSHAMVKVYTLVQSHADELAADQAAREFSQLLAQLIEQRRRQPRQDLLSALVAAEIDGQTLSDEELISTAVLLLNAGHEATVHQSGNAIKSILDSGLDPASLFSTAGQTRKTVDEAMRFAAPLHLFTRYALQELEIDGIRIGKGQQIGLLLGAANRDPARFSQPHVFDPWRQDGGHVSLGAGAHFCIGSQLARLELEISLPLLFSRLPQLRFATPPRYQDAFHFHGLQALDLCWHSSD